MDPEAPHPDVVKGTYTLLRKFPRNSKGYARYSLMAQNGNIAFFEADEFGGGFVHHGYDCDFKKKLWTGVIIFNFSKNYQSEYPEETHCGEYRMIVFQHEDHDVVDKLMCNITESIWGKSTYEARFGRSMMNKPEKVPILKVIENLFTQAKNLVLT